MAEMDVSAGERVVRVSGRSRVHEEERRPSSAAKLRTAAAAVKDARQTQNLRLTSPVHSVE